MNRASIVFAIPWRRMQRSVAVAATFALVMPPPHEAAAQFLSRPALPWRQLETAHFTFTFPAPLEAWTRDVASRIESIDSAVTRVVGYTPARRVQIVVDDPFNVSNGYALPFLDMPVITFWATPPTPRDDIGNYRAWGEMLATHEFAHVAHLARPSRSAGWRLLSQLSPVKLGPIPANAPRWVQEGYATYVEGRVTGSGRPNNAWRASILRQWALEGHLPTYGEMSGWGDFNGGDFAYLAGSAFFDWLAAREGGDSSLVHVWRRMTAKQRRSFDEAFAGVFGDAPQTLYGRFTVDVTARALEVRRLRSTPEHSGALVQHLSWATGDPAVSPDGSRAALVLRTKGIPSRVVVWRTSEPPDTNAARRATELLKRDPQDVPARHVYPPPRMAVATLWAKNGHSFEDPRFLPDGRRVLLWRNVPRGDGSVRPDIYLWDIQRGRVERITRGESVREPDPSPDGRRAAAVRCESGRCDLVRVDLSSGAVTTILQAAITSSFYRPRWSADGRSIAVSVQEGTRWRIAVVDTATRDLRFVDPPDDGGTRYDVAWLAADALVCVSERGGIANLERIDLVNGTVRTLTNVTGAAVAPEPDSTAHAIWFLSLHSRGYDVRRLVEMAADPHLPAPSVVADSTLAPALPPPPRPVIALGTGPVGPTRRYAAGSPSLFWVPTGAADASGVSAGVALTSTDLIGRLSVVAKGTLATEGAWRGGAFEAVWRGWRPAVEAFGFWARQLPSRAEGRAPIGDSLDATLDGGGIALRYTIVGDGWSQMLRLGGDVGRLAPLATSSSTSRNVIFAHTRTRVSTTGEGGQFASAALTLEGTLGELASDRFARGLATATLASGYATGTAIQASARYGRASSGTPFFDQFALGGTASPLVDEDVLSQRLEEPALPTGAAAGTEVVGFRIALPAPITPYVSATRVGSPGLRSEWFRALGAEVSVATEPIPVLRAPGGRLLLGVARARDDTGFWKIQAYAGVIVRP